MIQYLFFSTYLHIYMRLESQYNEKDLLLRLVNDDENAFAELYSFYHNRIVYFTMKFVKSEDTAQDIYQDIFTVIWQSRHFIDIEASFSSYLYTIARNRILNLLRDNAQEKKLHDHILSQAVDYESVTEESIVVNEYKELLNQAIAKLTERQRQIFELSRFEDLSHKEIAARLNISVYTVQEHISAALKIIKEYLIKYGSHTGMAGLLFFLVNKS